MSGHREAADVSDLEIEKLALEIRHLRLPWWQDPAYISAIAPALLGLAALATGFITGYFDTQSQRLAIERTQLELDVREFKDQRAALSDSLVALKDSVQVMTWRQRALEIEVASMRTGRRSSLPSPTPRARSLRGNWPSAALILAALAGFPFDRLEASNIAEAVQMLNRMGSDHVTLQTSDFVSGVFPTGQRSPYGLRPTERPIVMVFGTAFQSPAVRTSAATIHT